MIRERLLSEALDINVLHVEKIGDVLIRLHFGDELGCADYIDVNIYELAHKCKEWAHHNGYWMDSCFTGQIKLYHSGETYPSKTFHTEITEYEAIFKACEWILNDRR